MYSKNLLQMKVVEAHSGAKFQELYNRTAEELADYDPDVQIEHKSEGHCAYFMYNLHIHGEISVKEALNMAGISHHCSECPCLQIGTDKRKKRWKCDHAPYGESYMDAEMCDYAYQLLIEGKLLLRSK